MSGPLFLLSIVSTVHFINTSFPVYLRQVSSKILLVPSVLVRFYLVFIITSDPNWPSFLCYFLFNLALGAQDQLYLDPFLSASCNCPKNFGDQVTSLSGEEWGSIYYGLGKNFDVFKRERLIETEAWGLRQNSTEQLKFRDRQRTSISGRGAEGTGKNSRENPGGGLSQEGAFRDSLFVATNKMKRRGLQ